jgi:hypothetical protein
MKSDSLIRFTGESCVSLTESRSLDFSLDQAKQPSLIQLQLRPLNSALNIRLSYLQRRPFLYDTESDHISLAETIIFFQSSCELEEVFSSERTPSVSNTIKTQIWLREALDSR